LSAGYAAFSFSLTVGTCIVVLITFLIQEVQA
jgi:hypothetical protein